MMNCSYIDLSTILLGFLVLQVLLGLLVGWVNRKLAET